MPTTVTGTRLRELIDDYDHEVAVLDLRSPLDRTAGHIARSAGVPLHVLEQAAPLLVPRRETTVVLASDADVDRRGARILEEIGYRNVAVLENGLAGWTSAGERLYSGTNVRSKALGEWIEERYATPTVTSQTVQTWRTEGRDVVVLDSRPHAEYVHHHVEGGLDAGGGVELAYRGLQALSGPETTVVVNCAGRTRGIVGAQSLVNSGLTNPVYSLHNGTPAWTWAGGFLEHGEGTPLAVPEKVADDQLAWARRTLEAAGVVSLDGAGLAAVLEEPRTTYVIDVRRPEEYAAGHLPGSRSVQGGQLVQATDEHLAVQHSRVVLVDTEDRVRSAGTVQWLRFLHDGPMAVVSVEVGQPVPEPARVPEPVVPVADPATVREQLAAGVPLRLVDLRSSGKYAAGHLPGSVHARREHLAELAAAAGGGGVLLIGDHDYRPHFAAVDLAADHGVEVEVLEGLAGLEDLLTDENPRWAAKPADDTGPPPFGPERDRWYEAYFEWEYSLVPTSRGDRDFDFDALEERVR